MAGETLSSFDMKSFLDQKSPVETTTRDIDGWTNKLLLADASDTRARAETLYEKQTQERKGAEERYNNACSDVRNETCQKLGKTVEKIESPSEKIMRAKRELYQALGIKEGVEASDNLSKFKLGLADGLVGENIQAVEELLKIGIEKVANALLQMFSSLDKIKDFVVSAGEQMLKDVQNLASLEPYDTGKSIGGLGFGVIGSIWKNFGKATAKEALHVAKKEALEKGVMDLLEWKGRYMLPLDTHPNVMRGKMFEFGNAIDVRYLANDPERVKATMEIVEHLSDYVKKNETKIASLKPQELNAFKNDFMEVWNGYGKMLDQVELLPPNLQSRAVALKKDVLTPSYYSLNPQHKPEIPVPNNK